MLTDEGRTPAAILDEWRSAERELADCGGGSADYDRLTARVHELATEYREASRGDDSGDHRPR